MHLNLFYIPEVMVWMRDAVSCLNRGRKVCLGAWPLWFFVTIKAVLTRPLAHYFIGSKRDCNARVAEFLKCYIAYTSSSDVLCRQSQVVFPLACTYFSCLSFFNPCSSGLSDKLLDVCCCQGTGFRVQVLYNIPQQQQYVQPLSAIKNQLAQGLHGVTPLPGKALGKTKLPQEAQCLPVLLGPRRHPPLKAR